MRTKWNQPVYDEDPNWYEVAADGTVRRGLRGAYCDEDVEMFRTGYKCMNCDEPQENAYPEACPVCRYPIREKNDEAFAERFAGWRPLGPSIDWDEEQERLERQRFERLRSESASKSGIWVPGR